jgi:hypothetical protein
MCVNAMPVSAPASPAPSVKIGFAAEGRQLQVVARGAECRALRTKIGRLIDHHEDLHTLSNVSLAALLGFVGVLANKDTTVEGLAAVLLLVPACTPCQLFSLR